MLMLALPVLVPVSVTDAVMVWFPSLRVVEKLPPAPIGPLMLEVQARLAVRSPSSVSLAVPAKLIVAPEANVEPSAGLVMETEGGSFTGPLGAAASSASTRPKPYRESRPGSPKSSAVVCNRVRTSAIPAAITRAAVPAT